MTVRRQPIWFYTAVAPVCNSTHSCLQPAGRTLNHMHYLREAKENEPFYNQELKNGQVPLPIQLEEQSERYVSIISESKLAC